MEILTLKRPDISFSDEIHSYRQEFLDAGSPLNGCGPLADMEDPAEWVAHTVRFEKGDDIPEDMVPSTQFIYVRESGISDGRNNVILDYCHIPIVSGYAPLIMTVYLYIFLNQLL